MDKKRIAIVFTPVALIAFIIFATYVSNSIIKIIVSLIFILYSIWAIITMTKNK